MRSLQNHVYDGTTPQRKINNLEPYWRKRYKEVIKPPLDAFFEESLYPSAKKHPKHSDVHELDSDWSKRKVYGYYCETMGYEVLTDSSGRTTLEPIKDYNGGTERQEVCSWTSFLRYWAKEHPKLLVSSKPTAAGGSNNSIGSVREKKRKAAKMEGGGGPYLSKMPFNV
eukprot:618997-Ditylum_brightwellii.AAC.1